MRKKHIELIVTLGPSTATEKDLRMIKAKGADFLRINMSHSSIDDLKYYVQLAKEVGIPFIIDTEGSQVRTGGLHSSSVTFEENDEVKIYSNPVQGTKRKISLRPGQVVEQLAPGDIIHVDFDALILRVSDTTTIDKGYVTALAVNSGTLGRNKAAVVDSAINKNFVLPPLSDKDQQSITIGLEAGVGHIAASFMRSGEYVREVRRFTKDQMKIISKIECKDSLDNLDGIIAESDYLFLDRGDMSKEVPIEKIPFLQKILIDKTHKQNKKLFVATNLLETMVNKRKPTRAEVHDVIASILDGADGLQLSAETAVGKYPMECINVMNKLIKQAELIESYDESKKIIRSSAYEDINLSFFLEEKKSATLVQPHGGGALVNRVVKGDLGAEYLNSLQKIQLNQELQMDVEQIAIGTYSPIEGFMSRNDFISVLDTMRLSGGAVWTIPIMLDISNKQAERISVGDYIALLGDEGPMAVMQVEDKYVFDKDETVMKLYGTQSLDHPGVKWIKSLHPVLLGGKIELLKTRRSEYAEYSLTPRQVRRLFEEKNWSTVVGFHTRNVIHRSHEFIQLKAIEDAHCDGLFIHPVVGKKKPGDFNARYIISGYQKMMKNFYPKNKVVFGTFSTFSRYAGPREAIFTALCRKNFGCSHFIVGRDHTGVGNFYAPYASHDIFDQFPDLGITAIKFEKVFYSKKLNRHIHEKDQPDFGEKDKFHISGTDARKMFEKGQSPPSWFMRPELSKLIVDAITSGEEVFVGGDMNADRAGLVVWFSGLSGSGKSTIAKNLKDRLKKDGKRVTIIDGDAVRSTVNKHLGFSPADLKENNKIMSELAAKESKDYDYVLVPKISPNAEDRKAARKIVGANLIELYINCPLEECIKRDVKGLYKRALAGKIDDFIGISDSSPYEAPESPDLEIRTDQMDISQSVDTVYAFLVNRKNA